jgi:transcriptional regulator with XRE-family HTH domain
MNQPQPADPTTTSEVGVLLRHWRAMRGRSQFDLSLDTGVSQKHISFIESGRSAPGRQTLMGIAQALDVPLRDRNALLLAAGYAPVFSQEPWNAAETRSINKVLERMLRQHEPFPAVVMDRHWNVLMSNESAPRFFNRFIDLSQRRTPRNLLHLMFDPQGMRPFIANWDSVGKSLIQRVYRESVDRVIDDGTKELLSQLMAYPGIDAEWKNPRALNVMPQASSMPFIPISFSKDGVTLSYHSMITTVGTPQTVAAQELRIECMFPADEVTERHHET